MTYQTVLMLHLDLVDLGGSLTLDFAELFGRRIPCQLCILSGDL